MPWWLHSVALCISWTTEDKKLLFPITWQQKLSAGSVTLRVLILDQYQVFIESQSPEDQNHTENENSESTHGVTPSLIGVNFSYKVNSFNR